MFRSTAFLLGLACWAACCPADEKKVPLETEIPREILAGTPPNMLVKLFPNLEMPPDKAPELLVPEGTKNVALKKKITASDNEPILGKLEFITDGVKEGTEESTSNSRRAVSGSRSTWKSPPKSTRSTCGTSSAKPAATTM